MSLQCPKCQSERIDVLNSGKKAFGTIGTIVGCVGGVVAGLSGARVIGGMFVGGIAGGTTGAALGEVVDENILNNFHCLDCRYKFSLHRPIIR